MVSIVQHIFPLEDTQTVMIKIDYISFIQDHVWFGWLYMPAPMKTTPAHWTRVGTKYRRWFPMQEAADWRCRHKITGKGWRVIDG